MPWPWPPGDGAAVKRRCAGKEAAVDLGPPGGGADVAVACASALASSSSAPAPADTSGWMLNAIGEFADARIEAAFWDWQARRMAGVDAAASLVVAVLIVVGAIQFGRLGYPPGALLATAAALVALAVAAARRSETYLRHRSGLLASARISVAACTCVAAWLREAGVIPSHWATRAPTAVPRWLAMAKMPRVYALAVPALGFVLPPRVGAATSVACLAVMLTALESTVLGREAYFGRQANVDVAGALSAATRRALRPAAAVATAVAPHRATALLMIHMQATLGLLAPAQMSGAWIRVERARFRRARGPPRRSPRGGPLALTAGVDHALLALALHAAVWLGLWWALEEADAWMSRRGWGV